MVAPAGMQGSAADARDAREALLGKLSVGGAFAAMAIGAILALGSLLGGVRPAADRGAGTLPQPAVATAAPAGPVAPAAVGGAGSCPAQSPQPPAAANPGATTAGSAAFAVRTTIVHDTFGRRIVRGWGTAVQGGRYVVSGAPGGYAVDGSAGSQVTPTSGTTEVGGLGVNASALEARVRVSFNRYSRSGGENRARIIVRANKATDSRTYDYEFALSAPDGKNVLEAWIMRRVARVDYALGGDMETGLVQRPGAWFWLRAQIWGSSPVHLRLKIWPAGAAEPAGWNLDVVDNKPPLQLQAGGRLLLSSYGNSGLPLKVRFDDLRAVRLRATAAQGSGAAVAAPVASPGNAPACTPSAAGR